MLFTVFPGVSVVKNAPANAGSLCRKNPLEKDRATHSSILAWEIPWTEGPGKLQFMGSQKSQTRLSDQTTATLLFTTSRFSLRLCDSVLC